MIWRMQKEDEKQKKEDGREERVSKREKSGDETVRINSKSERSKCEVSVCFIQWLLHTHKHTHTHTHTHIFIYINTFMHIHHAHIQCEQKGEKQKMIKSSEWASERERVSRRESQSRGII